MEWILCVALITTMAFYMAFFDEEDE